MKLEEAMIALREGKKIRHPTFDDDVSLMACYISLMDGDKLLSVCKMKGDKQHSEMNPKFDLSKPVTPPNISIFILIDDTWEVLG